MEKREEKRERRKKKKEDGKRGWRKKTERKYGERVGIALHQRFRVFCI